MPCAPDAELRAAAALVFVEDLAFPELDAGDGHHLGEVLRLKPGEPVGAADGTGSWRICAFTGQFARRRRGPARTQAPAAFGLEAIGPVHRAEPLSPLVEIAFSWAKAERTEWAVAKLVELGVDVLTPLVADRTVVRPDREGTARRTERLRRIVRESAMQSRRPFLPRIGDNQSVDEIAARVTRSAVALAEPGGGLLSLKTPVVLVGPEGGWSPRELSLVDTKVSLGDGVLRVETAALAAGALLGALRSTALAPLR
ncbi:MAG: RsmE family RNA methyltransferase [Acidimicrobiales bacterium]